ncbi:MAG: DUF445 domain-containing protein [Acidimicrobiales bacterium]
MQRTLTPTEEQRARLLIVAKRRATGLLVAVTAVFVASTVASSRAGWLAWVQATAVASMVGGLADWFAVTALFRRPLGLPIPHTAIVVERKDRFADTLGAFVQESFLTPEAVRERLKVADAVPRAARWLADPAHAASLAAQAADALVAGADLLRDEDVHRVLASLGRQRLEQVPLAPLAGKALEQLTREGRHDPLLDAALDGLSRYLESHGAELHRRLGAQSPWWLPGPIGDRMVDRLIRRARAVLSEMARDRSHPLRQQLESGLVKLADDLQRSDDLRRRGEELKVELLASVQVRHLAAAIWREAKAELRLQAAQPGSQLRAWMTDVIAQTAARLRDDEELAASAERGLDTVVVSTVGRFDRELASLVSGTIARWDGAETSRRLELLLGPDLQYIRINGTLVGALAGLVLHASSQALG